MKRILASTALALTFTVHALADQHMDKFVTAAGDVQILGSEFIGARVYVVEKELDQDYDYVSGAETEWDDIGEINELVLTEDGKVEAVVIGVGGFVGIGEKDVAVSMDTLRFVRDGEEADDWFIVFTSSQKELEAAPEWDEGDTFAERKMKREEMRTAEYRSNMDDLNAVKRDGYTLVDAMTVTAKELTGARVYGIGDEDVGEIDHLVALKGSAKKEAIIDVGGFIGIGEKPVAVPLSDLRIMREADGDDLRVYIDATQDRLEKMPEYEGK